MSTRTVGGGASALSSVSEVRSARSKGYLLGLALSGSIWVVLCIATTISMTSPLVRELPSIALTQHIQHSSMYGGSLSAPPFDLRFE